MATLDDVKTLLMKPADDTSQDGLLNLIISNTEASLKLRVASKTVPQELTHIVTEVAVRRFNRLKNEGMKTYAQEGETITFLTSDFDDFSDDINAWLDSNANPKTLGHGAFINAYGGRK